MGSASVIINGLVSAVPPDHVETGESTASHPGFYVGVARFPDAGPCMAFSLRTHCGCEVAVALTPAEYEQWLRLLWQAHADLVQIVSPPQPIHGV